MITFVIADDSMVMRTILKYLIENLGHRVVGEARDGEEAVALYHNLKPEAVIIDVFMRGMDGIQAIKQIKQDNPAAKVFMVVDESQKSEESKAEQAGANGILRKPFDLVSVDEELKRVL